MRLLRLIQTVRFGRGQPLLRADPCKACTSYCKWLPARGEGMLGSSLRLLLPFSSLFSPNSLDHSDSDMLGLALMSRI